ncbi:MAG: serine/threonine protein kinase [Dysgonamonadaceae bacterium]|jgi:serine/threonine protein kinase|nr:serine/threonine protein kinase [Dysgonamonadaceae bacterium]
MKERDIIDRHYRLLRKLGSGGFSEVWLAENIHVTQLSVALKIYYPDSTTSDERQHFISKFQMVYKLHHTNLLPYSDCNEYNGMLYFVMPCCERGSVASRTGKLSEMEAWRFLADVSSGLAYLHQQNIVHQDIKPDNVLISDDDSYLITDFDISVKTKSTQRMGEEAPAGTAAYMAPERFGQQSAPIKASDVWALGASLYELLSGDSPFGDHGGLYQKSGVSIPDVNRKISRHLQYIINLCLQQEPWNRPTAREIADLCNEYFQNGKISFNTKFRTILGISKRGKTLDFFRNMVAYLKKLRHLAKKAAIVIGIAIAVLTVGIGVSYGISKVADYLKERNERMKKEEIIRQEEERAAKRAEEEAKKKKINDLLSAANAAFNGENPDYEAIFKKYFEAKQLGSTDTSGYSNFLRKAQELFDILGECDYNVRDFLLKAQQLNDTEEVRRELGKCGGMEN